MNLSDAFKNDFTAQERVAALKKKLYRQYIFLKSFEGHYGCGHALMKYINADYSQACRDINATLDELAEIDPSAPKGRF